MTNGISYRLERYFTAEQIANCLQVPEDYVISLINSGILECITLPGNLDNSVRIPSESFENFICNCQSKKEVPALQQVPVQAAEQQAPEKDSEQQQEQNPSPAPQEHKTCLSVFEV